MRYLGYVEYKVSVALCRSCFSFPSTSFLVQALIIVRFSECWETSIFHYIWNASRFIDFIIGTEIPKLKTLQ